MSDKGPNFKNDGLKAGLSKWKTSQPRASEPSKSAAPAPRPPPREKAPSGPGPDDEILFQLAMEDVAPIPKKGAPSGSARSPSLSSAREDAEALAELSELVSTGPVASSIDRSGCCGLASGADKALVERLRAGHFDVRQAADLSGAGAKLAGAAEKVLASARRAGLRCVRIVVDRGSWSEASLKAWLPRFKGVFDHTPTSRIVLAWTTVDADGSMAVDVVLPR